jgi:hypothetical protein
MFSLQRHEATGRLIEASQILELIARLENTPPVPDDLTVIGLRGLFIVQLYACLEFSVNEAIQRALILAQGYDVQHQHLAPRFFTVAMANHFQSVRDAGKSNIWKNRIKFVDNQFSSTPCSLNSVVFADELQNVWVSTIKEAFDCLGVAAEPLPDPSYRGYIDAIVDKRNAISHGRTSPVEIGRVSRSPELKKYWEIISETTEHIFQTLTTYIEQLHFVASPERARYQIKR